MKTKRFAWSGYLLCLPIAIALPVGPAVAQPYSILHQFAGGAGDGANPYASLTLDGAALYGMTYGGGASNLGTIFAIPEPGTSALVALGLGGLPALQRRKRSRNCELRIARQD